ncbi:MAG: MFS transporter [Candidatus Heimdallarchaeaceae archaeon]
MKEKFKDKSYQLHQPLENTEEDLYILPHPKRSLIGILISTFFLRVAFGSTTVLMPIFIFYHLGMQGWEANISIIIVEVTYALAVIVSSGYFGFKSDTSDSKKWILFGTAAGGLILGGYGVCALSWNQWIGFLPLTNGLLIFGMSLYHFLHGVAGSCKVNASYGYLSRFSVYENRATKVGIYNVAVAGGRSVGVGLAGVLYNILIKPIETEESWVPTYPQRLVFLYLIFGFAIVISAVLVYLLLDKTKPVVKEEHYNFKKELTTSWRLMTNKSRRGIVLPLLGTASAVGIINNWGFLVLAIETNPGGASLATIGITLAMGLPMALWGWVADKIGRKKTLTIGVVGIILLLFGLFFAFFTNSLTGGKPWNDPSSQFDPAGLYSNWWILLILGIAVLLGSAYFPAISGRLGDSSSVKQKLSFMDLL